MRFGPPVLILLAATVAVSLTINSMNADDKQSSKKQERLLRHVVLFNFKDDATEQDVAKIVEAFQQLPKRISQIHSFEYGIDNSPEGLADGFTHCFLVTFANEADREAYLPHPEHLKFVDILKPQIERVLVIDYWTQQ